MNLNQSIRKGDLIYKISTAHDEDMSPEEDYSNRRRRGASTTCDVTLRSVIRAGHNGVEVGERK